MNTQKRIYNLIGILMACLGLQALADSLFVIMEIQGELTDIPTIQSTPLDQQNWDYIKVIPAIGELTDYLTNTNSTRLSMEMGESGIYFGGYTKSDRETLQLAWRVDLPDQETSNAAFFQQITQRLLRSKPGQMPSETDSIVESETDSTVESETDSTVESEPEENVTTISTATTPPPERHYTLTLTAPNHENSFFQLLLPHLSEQPSSTREFHQQAEDLFRKIESLTLSPSTKTAEPTPINVKYPLTRTLEPPPSIKQLAESGINVRRDFEGEYKATSTLPKGTFGTVFRYTSRRNPAQHRIVKSAPLDSISSGALRREAGFLNLMNHPNILKLLEMAILPPEAFFDKEQQQLALILEDLPGYDMQEWIESDPYAFNEKMIGNIILLVVVAVRHMHHHHLAHRDLAPKNILIQLDKDNQIIQVKVTDFSITLYTSGKPSQTIDITGNPLYSGPETILPTPSIHAMPGDIWSIGATTYFGLSKANPYPGNSENAVVDFRINNQDKEIGTSSMLEKLKTSSAARAFVKRCCNNDQLSRPPIDELLKYPWLDTLRIKESAL